MKKHSLYFLTILFFFIYSGCAGPAGDSATNPTTSNQIVSNSGYIGTTDNKVAYVLNIESGEANIYIPSVDRYAIINLSTGLFVNRSGFLFSGVSCTGTVRADRGFVGEIGKSIVYDGTSYYRILTQASGSFSYQSVSYNGAACQNISGSASTSYTFESATIPYSFTALAPIAVKFQ